MNESSILSKQAFLENWENTRTEGSNSHQRMPILDESALLEISLDEYQHPDTESDFFSSEEDYYQANYNASPMHFLSLMVGAIYGFSAAAIAWVNGLALLPILGIYSAVGCATMLTTAVILALASIETDEED